MRLPKILVLIIPGPHELAVRGQVLRYLKFAAVSSIDGVRRLPNDFRTRIVACYPCVPMRGQSYQDHQSVLIHYLGVRGIAHL